MHCTEETHQCERITCLLTDLLNTEVLNPVTGHRIATSTEYPIASKITLDCKQGYVNRFSHTKNITLSCLKCICNSVSWVHDVYGKINELSSVCEEGII